MDEVAMTAMHMELYLYAHNCTNKSLVLFSSYYILHNIQLQPFTEHIRTTLKLLAMQF